ncbi:MAG: NYN domain-containing protein, partial [Acidimicrobiales bacterium]
ALEPPPAAAGPIWPGATDALTDAAEAAVQLAGRLRAAADALSADALSAPPTPDEPLAAPALAPAPAAAVPRQAAKPVRRPVPLPPAVYDDSREAADHLVRVPAMMLVIDGYNVSQAGWPALPIAEQRNRLVDALGELAARTGADARVVFDGADVAMPGTVPTTPKAVRVTFSPPGVEADDVVVDLVSQLPVQRPVTVASSDRRVQRGARNAGANVISSQQLLLLLGR